MPPKAINVLVRLAESPGEVVEHNELLESAWGRTDGGHDSLIHCISAVRAALDDHPDDPDYIETLPKRGYRLIAPVTPLDQALESGGTSRGGGSAPASTGLHELWSTLKERNVVRVSIAYAAVAWVLMQFADLVFEALALPAWSIRVFVVVLAAGFLLAVLIAWAYQVVPEVQDDGTSSGLLPRRRLQQIVDLAIIAVLTVGVGFLGYRQFVLKPVFDDHSQPMFIVPDVEPDEHSVAVLRFANLGGDPRFSDGLAENLLHLLARFKEVTVPSRTTTWNLSDQKLGVVDIAKKLRVRYILEGTVQQQNEQIRVVTQLIEGGTGNHIWSEIYDEELTAESFFHTQDDIAQHVVERIHATLSKDSKGYFQRLRTRNFEALDHYLRGRHLLREPKSAETLAAAVEAFRTALSEDPEYVEAMAGLCDAHLARYTTTHDADDFGDAEHACLGAAGMKDSLGEVYAAMGSLYRHAGRYNEAILNLNKALDLLPNSAPILEELGAAYQADNKLLLAEETLKDAIGAEPGSWSVYKSMGNFLFRTGRYPEAVPYYRQVISLQGSAAIGYNNLAVTYFMMGHFDEANTIWSHVINENPTRLTLVNYANSLYYAERYADSAAMCERALEMDAADHRVWRSMAASLRLVPGAGDRAKAAYRRAIKLAEASLEINPNDPETLSQIAVSYARTGTLELAEHALARVIEVGWENPNTSFFVALAHHLLGRDEDAVRELERAIVMGFPRALIAWDPDFQTLSANQRYMALLEATDGKPGS